MTRSKRCGQWRFVGLSRAGLVLLALANSAVDARAQVSTAADTTVVLERFEPALGAVVAGVPSADVLESGAWLALAAVSVLHEPLVLRDIESDAIVSRPVQDRVSLYLGAARGIGKRYQLGFRAPAIAWQRGDRLAGIGIDETPLESIVVGDLTIEGRARLVGSPGTMGAAVGLGIALTLPTGDGEHFAGEAGTVVDWRLVGGYRHRWGEVSAFLGPRLRGTESVLLSPANPQGNEVVYGLGGNVRVPAIDVDVLRLGVELVGARGDAVGGGGRGPSPLEARAAVIGRVGPMVSVTVGAGVGLTADEIGSPDWRGFAAVVFESQRASDADGDGYRDAVDPCPLIRGTANGCAD